MNSTLLTTVHVIAVNLFILIYLVKTILLFSNQAKLDSFSKKIKVPEMIISTLFLVTGIWLYAIVGAIKTFHVIKLLLIFTAIPLAVVGFKKHKKGLALIAFFFIVGAYGLAEMSRSKPYMAKKTIPSEQVGLNVYQANCVMCHGEDGKKNYRGAVDLSSSVMDQGGSEAIISSGVKKGTHGSMPAFESTLSSDEIRSVAQYIQSLKK